MRPALDRDSAPSVPTSDIKASPSSFDTARVVEPFPLDPEYGDSLPDAAWLLGDNCTLKGISAAIGGTSKREVRGAGTPFPVESRVKLEISDRRYPLRLCSFGQTCVERFPGMLMGPRVKMPGDSSAFRLLLLRYRPDFSPRREIVDLDGGRVSNVGTEVEFRCSRQRRNSEVLATSRGSSEGLSGARMQTDGDGV